MKYTPYKPTALEQRIDKVVRLISPRRQADRVISRERENYFRYLAAYPTSSRRNSTSMTSGETMKGAREKLQVMWNAINAVDNSGLCTSIVTKFQLYTCGTLRWQSRCGDRTIANEYEDYMRTKLGKSIDVTGRYSLRQMAMLDIKGILVKGDIGTNVVRDGKEIYLQGIEADRIGNPYDYQISNNYVRGLILDDAGAVTGVKIFSRDRATGTYRYDQTIPMQDKRGMPRFLFLANPISYDDYRGVSAFKTAIDNATYIDRIREYELQALMWAASQSGVYHTKSGALPEALPFDTTPLMDADGNKIETYQVRPNTVTALGVGEDVVMFQHDRPSPNVIGILKETVRDISVGTGLSYGMVWDMSGYTGPAVRMLSAQDARAIEIWQWTLREGKLDPVAMLVLGNGIANKEIPFTKNWMKWEWFFPAKSTIDVGRESQANIDEIHAGINTGARVAADDGMDIDEIQEQRGRETEAQIETAMEIATNLSSGGETIDWREVYQLMFPLPKGKTGGGGAFPAPQADAEGVTGDGVQLDGGRSGGNGNGKRSTARMESRGTITLRTTSKGMEIIVPDTMFYREDQERDDHGRFADEGKGDQPSQKKTLSGLDVTTQASEEGKDWQMHYAHDKGSAVPKARMLTSTEPDKTVAIRLLESAQEGKGYGASLLQHADKVAADQGAHRVISDPEGGTKDRAVKLLVKNGYLKVPHPSAPEGYVWEKPVAGKAGTVDKMIADYKPDRSLSDPTKTEAISKVVPGVKYVPYSQTPFFRHLNILQGNGTPGDPLKHGVEDYIKQRQMLFETIPVTQVPLDHLVATQEMVNKDRVQEMQDKPETRGNKPAQVVIYNGEKYFVNGHHRLAADALAGAKTMPAHVLDLDHPDPVAPKSDDGLPGYIRQLQSSPDYKTVAARLYALDHDPIRRESYTLRQALADPNGELPTATSEKTAYEDAKTKVKPEKLAEYEKIINSQLNPKAVAKEGTRPVATILIGPPAAGKTSTGLPGIIQKLGQVTVIGADNLREPLSGYRGWNTPATQDEAKLLHGELSDRALAARMNIVYDEVGGKIPKMVDKINALGAMHYDVHVVHVDAPMHETLPRAWDRFKTDGRYTDTSYLLDAVDRMTINTYNAVKDMPQVKYRKSVDNEGFKKHVIEEY